MVNGHGPALGHVFFSSFFFVKLFIGNIGWKSQ